jgi:hypothetical protein
MHVLAPVWGGANSPSDTSLLLDEGVGMDLFVVRTLTGQPPIEGNPHLPLSKEGGQTFGALSLCLCASTSELVRGSCMPRPSPKWEVGPVPYWSHRFSLFRV